MNPDSRERNERAYRIIETMLRHAHPRVNDDAVIASVKNTYDAPGSLAGTHHLTLRKTGMHPHDAILFMVLPDLVRYIRRNRYINHPQLGRLKLASDFLIDNSVGLKVERFYLICLDARGRMKECTMLHEGTQDGALFSLRGMLAHIARLSPNAVIMSHNHPGGTLKPSREDIDCTLAAIESLSTIGIPLLDHIITADDQAVSLRDNGFIPAHRWLQQAQDNRLLQNWLSEKNYPTTNNIRQPKPRQEITISRYSIRREFRRKYRAQQDTTKK